MGILLNNRIVHIDEQQAGQPLLNWLRQQQHLSATKEGCGAGDCGACSVLVGKLSGGSMRYQVVNACLLPVGSLQACHVLTLEGLSDGPLHAIQDAMIEHHASQCGFCTPGIVMAMLAWWLNTPANQLADQAQVEAHRHEFTEALSGNLCRCTGYEPIFKAAASLAPSTLGGNLSELTLAGLTQDQIKACLALEDSAHEDSAQAYFLPQNDEQLALAYDAAPNARLICGATDVGLEVTQQLTQHTAYIDLSAMPELQSIAEVDGELRIGASVTFSQLEEYFTQHESAMSQAWLQLLGLIGSRQIRNRGSLGGNIANGSPIADTPPLLLALDAQLVLQQGKQQRIIALREFFLGYRHTALQAGEIIRQIRIPPLPANSQLFVSKISKRQEDDISAACVVLWRNTTAGQESCRIGLGGMAATPTLASKAASLIAANGANKSNLLAALGEEFTPLDDVRASANYRLQVCANTLAYWAQEGGEA